MVIDVASKRIRLKKKNAFIVVFQFRRCIFVREILRSDRVNDGSWITRTKTLIDDRFNGVTRDVSRYLDRSVAPKRD